MSVDIKQADIDKIVDHVVPKICKISQHVEIIYSVINDIGNPNNNV